MHHFIPKDPHLKLQDLQRWSKLRQEQLSQAVTITKDTVLGFVRRLAEHGNWQAIEQLLKGKPMTKAGKFLLQELRASVVSSLILRLGMRRVLAVGLAGILLPFILAKVAQEVLSRVKRTPDSDALKEEAA